MSHLPEQDLAVRPAATRATSTLLWVGVALLALNLRLGVTAIPPILPELKSGLGLSTTGESVLAALPVVCFGIVSAIAAPATRRFGEERVLFSAMTGIALGIGCRALWPSQLLFFGTIIMASAIAFANVLLASLIKRREPHRAGLLIGIYLVMLSGGSTAASALTVPIFDATRSSFHVALGVWALPALLAMIVWTPQLRHRTLLVVGPRQRLGLVGQRLAWQVTGFMGLQSCCYYAVISWLPTMLRHRGLAPTTAGLVVALLSVGGVLGAFPTSTLAGRRHDHRSLVAPMTLSCLVGIVGLVLAPLALCAPFALILGVGQGAALALALLFVIARAPNPAAAASLSAMAQGVGYCFAALGPIAVGFIHAMTNSWPAAFALIAVLTLAQWLAGSFAARPITLPILAALDS